MGPRISDSEVSAMWGLAYHFNLPRALGTILMWCSSTSLSNLVRQAGVGFKPQEILNSTPIGPRAELGRIEARREVGALVWFITEAVGGGGGGMRGAGGMPGLFQGNSLANFGPEHNPDIVLEHSEQQVFLENILDNQD